MTRNLHEIAVGLALGIAGFVFSATSLLAAGMPFGPPPPLSVQYDAADVVYHAQLMILPGKAPPPANWKIVGTIKAGAPVYRPGETVESIPTPENRTARDQSQDYALFGQIDKINKEVRWSSTKITPAVAVYLREMPPPDLSRPEITRRERLRYFLNHLSDEDSGVAEAANAEFDQATFEEQLQLADTLSREKLQAWLQSSDANAASLGRYGLLLGLCGTPEDADLLKSIVIRPTDDFRRNIESLMFGYLLLAGEAGLTVIEESKFHDPKSSFSETYAAKLALRRMWQHGNGRIPADRLRQSMRLLLDKPELVDLVVADLALMEDWSVQDRLMKLYTEPEFDIPSLKRAIVRYFLQCAEFQPESPGQPEPDHVRTAKQHLAALTERDPKTVKDAKRFFVKRKG